MLNDLAWRKVPRNIIRDENIEYISFLLPEHLKAAPMLLYFIMYCKADDEGVVDLEDGAIYSRLMMNIATPTEVIEIASLMVRRKLLIPVLDGHNVFIIDDWDIPVRPGVRAARTMEERRKNVAQKILQAQENRAKDVQNQVDWDAIRQRVDFLRPLNDKNVKNVDTQREEREIRENLESIENRETIEIETEREKTHTEGNSGAFLAAPFVAKEILQEHERQTELQKTENTKIELDNLAAMALNATNDEGSNTDFNFDEQKRVTPGTDKNAVYVVFRDFFAKNCLGFSESRYKNALEELTDLICDLEDKFNPATAIATVFCQQFKVLTETEGYYKNLPLFPVELLKPGVYRTVLSMASKILCNKKSANIGWIQQSKALKDVPEGRAVYDEVKQLYVQCNIDPNGAHPLRDYLMKKVTAIK